MNIQLSQNQQRVIGCLIEKSLTTPDQYPLSLNALTNACNQKSNREPVLSLSENVVQETIDELRSKQLVMNQSGNTSRVQKYKHRFCNTEFGELQLSPQELAIVCVLFLRGPQTPGELRTRTNRLCEFQDVHETESVLTEMKTAEPKPFVIRLEREAGKRDSRYAHCFADLEVLDKADEADNSNELAAINDNTPADINQNSRIIALEEQVELMQLEIDELRQMIESARD
ncbi:MAG: DUF480 domain-containing protein [Kangiella sp.]|nr:MAG: DUF480 domain-containing protein [Kangiella sp.]